MSPTSCQLLYPAMYRYMGRSPIFPFAWCKDSEKIDDCKNILDFFVVLLANALCCNVLCFI